VRLPPAPGAPPGALASGSRLNKKASLLAPAVLALNGGLAVAALLLWLNWAVQGTFWRADFSFFYAAWAMALDGRGARLYDLDLQTEYQDRVVPERGGNGELVPFNYPPHTAFALAPLALLPRQAAFYAWAVIQLGLLLLALRFLRELAADWDPGERRLLLVTVLAFPPLLMTFQLGQYSLLALVCLLGVWRGLRQDRPVATGFWLALGSVKPQLVLFPALVLLAGRRWRALGAALAFFLAWAALTTVAFGPSCWRGFVEVIRYSSRQFGSSGIDPLSMYNLKGVYTAVLGSQQAALVNALAGGTLLLATLGTLWAWRAGSPSLGLGMALTLLVGLLCNPHVYAHDTLTLVLPAVLFYDHLRRRGPPAPAVRAVLALGPLLFLLDRYGPASLARPVRPFTLLMLALALAMAWSAATRAQPAGESQPAV
jgi:hypothetical protein